MLKETITINLKVGIFEVLKDTISSKTHLQLAALGRISARAQNYLQGTSEQQDNNTKGTLM